jgi:hypothetical protein
MSAKKFHEIFSLEVEAINRRRDRTRRPKIVLELEERKRDGTPILRPAAGAQVIGLALSGGGIRSSAFCLGALQALDIRVLIEKIDYLSSVSGGGYIGTSMTAAMSTGTVGKFPFASELRAGEVPGVQHIRDHSNYLFPQGLLNIFGNGVVYLRGIVANVMLLLPYLLFAAAFTIWLHPTVDALPQAKIARYGLDLSISGYFGWTRTALLAFVLLLAVWALWRSTPWGRNISDIGFGVRFFGVLAVAILIIGFCELQPLLLGGMRKLTATSAATSSGVSGGFSTISSGLNRLAAVFAPIGAVIGFLGRMLADLLKRTTEKPGYTAFVMRIAIKVAMYVAGAAVPLVLWVAYLNLSSWGIKDCVASGGPCNGEAPAWLTKLAGGLPVIDGSILRLYVTVALPMAVIGWSLSANANSLHRLYRDRLSKAFLFDPAKRINGHGKAGAESDPSLRNADLWPLDRFRVSELNADLAPYHLINSALNIEASKYANRRDRNADFFIFSPLFTGSESTGYVDTKQMEAKMSGLTLGTAMAVSGAAASSNMGSATAKPLVPTLAILNIRLGYWITNPAKVAGALQKHLLWRFFDRLYFIKELLGLLTENSETVYLTDGGHIENLGIYELLRRRCKLIVAIDAEADPDMSFGSLVTLERYARIDFGVRIDLAWAALRDATRSASAEVLDTGGLPADKASHGPHCALGTIYYPRKTGDDETASTGLLLYIKSSFTGDENDYIVDYKRRNPTFPHETTLDQFFGEEQVEAYRALGFHAVDSAFNLTDEVSMRPNPAVWQGNATSIPLEQRLREIMA